MSRLPQCKDLCHRLFTSPSPEAEVKLQDGLGANQMSEGIEAVRASCFEKRENS